MTELLLIVGVLLLTALHPVHRILRVAFAVSEQNIAIRRGWTLVRRFFIGGLTCARSAFYMSGTHRVVLVCLR